MVCRSDRQGGAGGLGRDLIAMIRQHFRLDNGWEVFAYYAVSRCFQEEIMDRLYEIGCRDENLRTAYENLTAGKRDTGLTYSNHERGQTVLVISQTSSPEEFMNSFEHETFHLKQHIAKSSGMDLWGEEIAYLSGEIAQKMFPVAKMFLCECQRCRGALDKIRERRYRSFIPEVES